MGRVGTWTSWRGAVLPHLWVAPMAGFEVVLKAQIGWGHRGGHPNMAERVVWARVRAMVPLWPAPELYPCWLALDWSACRNEAGAACVQAGACSIFSGAFAGVLHPSELPCDLA